MAQQVNTTLVVNAVNGGVDDYLKKVEAQVDRISKKIANMGGQYSQALANVLDPSRSPASTKTAGAVFTQATEGMTRLMEAQTTQMKTKGEEARKSVENTAERNRLAAARSMSLYGTTNVDAITKIQKAKAEAALETHTKRTGAINERAAAVINQTIAGEEARRLRQQKVQDTFGNWNATDLEQVGQKKLGIAGGFVSLAEQRAAIRERNMQTAAAREQVAQMGADRRTRERGGTIREVIQDRRNLVADQLIDRGATKAEYRKQIEEERKAEHERRKERRAMRSADKAEKLQEQQQAKQDALGSNILRMLPGGSRLDSMLTSMSRFSPNAANFAGRLTQGLGNWGSQSVGMVRALGPANPNALPGTIGAAFPGGGGGIIGGFGASGLATAGAVAGGLAMAAVGTVYLGEKGLERARQAVGNRLNPLIGMEMTARQASAAGGAQSLNAAMMEVGDLSYYGIDKAKGLQMYSSFLNTRGSSARMAKGETAGFLETSAKYNMDPAIGGIASSLGYSSAGNAAIAKSLQSGAGLGGAALSGAAQSMLAQEQRAAGYGLMGTGIAVKNAQFASQLSQSGYGGGQYGGAAVVQKVQNMGGNMADSIRGSLKQMADVQVFAEGVKRSGSLLGGIEMTDQFSAKERMGIAQANEAGRMGMFGYGLSQDQAAGNMRRAVGQAVEPNFKGPSSQSAAQHEDQMNTEALNSKLLAAIQNMDQNIEKSNMRIVNSVEFIENYIKTKGAVAKSTPDGLTGWAVASIVPGM